MITEKVKHRSRPSEPFASPNAIGQITKDPHTEKLRITPAAKGIPAQAFVNWGEYSTWERLSDLLPIAEKKSRDGV